MALFSCEKSLVNVIMILVIWPESARNTVTMLKGNRRVKKMSWDEIPTLENLQVDWDYEPENPLGKRSSARLLKKDLQEMFEVDCVPVKIVSEKFDKKSYLIDISTKGLAVFLDTKIQTGMLIKLGFFLGKHKIISRGIVRNNSRIESDYRIGIEFLNLDQKYVSFITSLNSSKIHHL